MSEINRHYCKNDKGIVEVHKKIFINPKYKVQQAELPVPNTNIHINPLFKNAYFNPLFQNAHGNTLFQNAHVNPHFKKDITSINKVHINPKLFKPLLLDDELNSTKREECSRDNEIITSKLSNTSPKYSYVSNRKLVRNTVQKENETKIDKSRTFIKRTKNKLIRLPIQNTMKPLNKLSKLNIMKTQNNKLKFAINIKSLSAKKRLNRPANICEIGKPKDSTARYKLDRRIVKPVIYKSLHESRCATQPNHRRRSMFCSNKIISIDGRHYKSSATKLRSTKLDCHTKNNSSRIVKKMNKRVNILGIEYLIQGQGKSLKKIRDDCFSNSLPKSNTIYVTKTKLLRSVQHKNRVNLKLNNIPCTIYRKFGFCKRHELGRCFKIHDKNQIDICKNFLAGRCALKECTLSHDTSAAKMPICLHYLAGACGRDNCPYPHIKHSRNVTVCKLFLRGYCSKAEKCDQRHVFICPDFDKSGLCPRIRCPYPHGVNKSKKVLIKKSENMKDHHKKVDEIENVTSRYYKTHNDVEKDTETSEDPVEELTSKSMNVSKDENDLKIINKRPALGLLPSYIPI